MPSARKGLLFGFALAACAAQVAMFHGVRADDAYITYRYGQNLASGEGLVFNPGQHVQGSTSPGQMLLAALVYGLVGLERTPGVLAAIGCVGWSLQVAAAFLLLEGALGSLGAAAIALALALGVSGAAAWVALETNLVTACVLVAFVCAQRQRWTAAAFWSGLAVVFRPDAWLAAVVLGCLCSWQLRSRVVRPVLVFALLALPWPIFAGIYYGSAIPQTALTKFQRAGLWEYCQHEFGYPSLRLLWSGPGMVSSLLGAVLVGAGALRLLWNDRALAPFVAYGAVHALAYLVLRPFIVHGWHLYPWTLVYCVCALGALVPRPNAGSRALSLAQALATVAVLGLAAQRFVVDCRELADGYWTGQRDRVYRRLASELQTRARPGDWFASIEVGTLAFYAQLPAYDLGGLVTRADDPLRDHPVRFIVLDGNYPQLAPPVPPAFSARDGRFEASVYELP